MRAISHPSAGIRRIALAAVLAWAGLVSAVKAGDPDPIFGDGFENQPIVAPAGTWTFVPFANAFCGNETTTGIGINPSATGNRVLLFLTGGGACWDNLTCMILQTATNFNSGYGPAQFAGDLPQISTGFFDRNAMTNPFRDYHYVYVPYCTGDIHAGNNIVNYGGMQRRHVGYANVGAYLERLVATFPSAGRVVLAGASAGGFGAVMNWERVQRAFGNVRVDMINDSGTFMPASIVSPTSASELARAASWNLAATLPPGCTACSNGLDNIFGYYATSMPNNRGALLTYRPDSTISNFYQISQANFTTGLNQILPVHFDPFPTKRYFVVAGPSHVLFDEPGRITGGITLETFITRMVNDDPAWANATP